MPCSMRALAVAWAESYFAQSFPSQWSYLQGGMLIVVILLLPGGVASLVNLGRRRSWYGKRGKDKDGYSKDPADAVQSPARDSTVGVS